MPVKSYAILSTPRTGSTMLCSALKLVSGGGQPLEHLNNRVIAQLPPHVQERLSEVYFPTLHTVHAQRSQAFGTKMHFDQFEKVFVERGKVTSRGAQVLQSFERLILVTRKDRILQALSYLRAHETQIWASSDERHAGQANYAFSPEQSVRVTRIIHDFQRQENAWRTICARLELPFLEILYEDLAENPCTVLAKVHDWLGFPQESIQAPTTVKLSSAVSLSAKEAYLRTIGA